MQYRPEIDGLRAVAVIPVILFHAGFTTFGGGFVGVDIFFVISGYLITTIILSDMQQDTFSLASFYERRTRRILPALFLVVLISLPFAWLWMTPAHLKEFSESVAAVSVFSSNILFWHESGYWETASELKPLLHTWSLAVEEQYYVLFPLFLMLMWRYRRRWIFSSFLIMAGISLLAAQWGAFRHPVATFYLLPSRGWELAIGAGIAFYFLYRKQAMRRLLSRPLVNEMLGLLGLVMIAYAILVYNSRTPFPSFYALTPTLGASLIIIFSSPQTIVGRLLGRRALVGIGLISYSAYLWHQPLFAFARHRAFTPPTEEFFLLLVLFTFLLAYLSWRYVEIPFRKKTVFSRRMIFTFAAVGTSLFLAIGLSGHYADGFQNRFKVKQSILNDFTWSNVRAHCDVNADLMAGKIDFCTLGSAEKKSNIQFAVFGDSHARSLLPAFDTSAHAINASYVHIGLGGCPPILDINVIKGNYPVGLCEELTSRQYEYVKKNNIKKVFFVARWSMYTDGDFDTEMGAYFLVDEDDDAITQENSRIVFARGLKNTIKAYRDIGVSVYILDQFPQQMTDPDRLYFKLSNFNFSSSKIDRIIADQSISRQQSDKIKSFSKKILQQLAIKGEIQLVNLDDFFCDASICLLGDHKHSRYLDKNHLSVFGTTFVADEIQKYIQ